MLQREREREKYGNCSKYIQYILSKKGVDDDENVYNAIVRWIYLFTKWIETANYQKAFNPIIFLFPCLRNMNSPCGCQALANIISRFDSLSSIPRWCHNAICHRRIDTERHHHSPSWNAYPRGAFSIINRPVFAARRGIGMRERERENRPPSSRHPRK